MNLLKKGVYDSSLPLSPSLSPSHFLSASPLSLSLSLACKAITYCKVWSCIDDAGSHCLECIHKNKAGLAVCGQVQHHFSHALKQSKKKIDSLNVELASLADSAEDEQYRGEMKTKVQKALASLLLL